MGEFKAYHEDPLSDKIRLTSPGVRGENLETKLGCTTSTEEHEGPNCSLNLSLERETNLPHM